MDALLTQLLSLAREFQTRGGWDLLSPYLTAIVIVAIGYVVARSVARGAEALIRQMGSEHSAVITQKLVFYGLLVVAILIALTQLGIKLSGLLAAAGIFTVALGFAAQTSVSNVISGFFLFMDRPFSINDTVKIDTTLGTVVSIDLLSTRIRTFDNLMVRIPNEALLKSTIINYTLFNVRRVDIPVAIQYGTDLQEVREIILEVLDRHPTVLDEPAPAVLFDALGESGVSIIVRAWIERSEFITSRSELTMGIHDALAAHGIRIPMPQRMVHLQQSGGPWQVEPARPAPTDEKSSEKRETERV